MLAMKAIRGASWLVFSRFLGRLIDFLTLLILARILTPADFGVVALAMTLIAIVDIILEIPVTQALTRLAEIDKSHLDTGFTLSLLRGLFITAVVLAAAWPFAILYKESSLIALVVALAIGPIARGLYSPGMVRFVRQLSFRQAFIAEFIGKLVAFAAAIAVVFLGGGYWALVANFVMASAAATIASYVLAPYRPSLSLSRFTEFSGFIGWFSSAQIVSALNWQFDRVLLGTSVDKATLGRYAVASDLAVFPTQSLVGPAMQPVMAAFSKVNSDPGRLQLAFLKAARFAMLISAPACIGISLTADIIVALLLGPKWHETAMLLQLLALSVVTIPYFQTLYSFSLAIDAPSTILKLNLIDLALRIILISLGFYFFSVFGAALARVVLSVAMFACYLLYVRNLAAVSVSSQLKNIWKIAVASAALALAVLLLRQTLAPLHLNGFVELAIAVTMGAAVYVGALLACGVRLIVGPGRLEVTDRW
jgi:lipopolysaccharide exporter